MNYLIGIDNSEFSHRAVEYVKTIVKEEDVVYLVTATNEDSQDTKDIQSKYSNLPFQSKFNVIQGDAREVILHFAEENKIDVIVVGHRGLGQLQRLFLGSVSDYVVKHSKTSVIVV
eukprot:TRINITY_DN3976_c0_g1_i1.p1 TRINITY_DN3976_c0_g1~~TRINITY_DN3976_c0_g1_i1.p1  ORF type:complete len:116 (-),score=27.90 TRINITY_DN3976_c0_g1_i1:58-405(-)